MNQLPLPPLSLPKFFYYITMSVFGAAKGLIQLNLGAVTSFQARCAVLGPVRWALLRCACNFPSKGGAAAVAFLSCE